jgi:hypothetical protein
MQGTMQPETKKKICLKDFLEYLAGRDETQIQPPFLECRLMYPEIRTKIIFVDSEFLVATGKT